MNRRLTNAVLHDLADIAEQAARSAGEIIVACRQEDIVPQHKQVGDSVASQVVTEVDYLAEDAIRTFLQPTCDTYGLALLTEETADDGRRHDRPAFWCVDPLDGTQSFVDGTAGYAVSIALVARDATPLIGIVVDPVEAVTYRAVRGEGASRNGAPLAMPVLDPRQPLSLQADSSFRQHHWRQATESRLSGIAERLGMPGSTVEYRTGAVMNACRVLENANRCYFKYPRAGAAGGSLWDYAATACLFNEVRAFASDLMNGQLDLNREDSTFMNHRGVLFASEQRIAEGILALYTELAD
ncbi:MAG: inositol monophosphatase [Gammaproteobacteria bacterium]|nr:inositol monophosphatase [Gammaproteobacteria bacterium]